MINKALSINGIGRMGGVINAPQILNYTESSVCS